MDKGIGHPYRQLFAACLYSTLISIVFVGCGGETQSGAQPVTTLPASIVEDRAVFSGNRANYTVVKSETGYTIIDNAGQDGTTNVGPGITRFQFADIAVSPGIGVLAASINGNDLKTLIGNPPLFRAVESISLRWGNYPPS